jgi:hypothetical protein
MIHIPSNQDAQWEIFLDMMKKTPISHTYQQLTRLSKLCKVYHTYMELALAFIVVTLPS